MPNIKHAAKQKRIKTRARPRSSVQRSYNDALDLAAFRRLPVIVITVIIGAGLLMAATTYLNRRGSSGAATYTGTGPALTYNDDARTATVNGVSKTLGTDIRIDSGGTPGTISAVTGGVQYTSYPKAERTENVINGSTNPLWPDNSSGWFAFDFTVHDVDSSWRVIEQEHEGDMSPSRSLEAFQNGSSSIVKLASRYGTPDVNGPDNTWQFSSSVGTRIQIYGYEKFGQGDAIMLAWWRPYGSSTWTQFANSTNFSMGYTSGNPGRYHKRGTYHGNHAEQSSVTWYGTAVMHTTMDSALTGAGITTAQTPTPPPPPTPTPSPTPAPTPPPPPPVQTPRSVFNGQHSIPGTTQAEDYDNGGEGLAYHDLDAANQGGKYRTDGVDIETASEGGYNLGWVGDKEWTTYTVNVTAGTYDFAIRIASGIGGTLQLKVDGAAIGTLSIPVTGGWQAWQTVMLKNVTVPGGTNKVLRLDITGNKAGQNAYNINWFSFTKPVVASTPPPAPGTTPSPAPASGGATGNTSGIVGNVPTTQTTVANAPKPGRGFFGVIMPGGSDNSGGQPTVQPINTSDEDDASDLIIDSSLRITDITGNSATVIWQTSRPTKSDVEYGSSLDFGKKIQDDSYVSEHKTVIRDKGFEPGKTYYLRITATDKDGQLATSPVGTFTTMQKTAGRIPVAVLPISLLAAISIGIFLFVRHHRRRFVRF